MDGIVKKKDEEMKWFKLELQNRENNFNKVFGSQPNVGVLNPNTTGSKTKNQGKENSRMNLQSGQGQNKTTSSSKNIAWQAAMQKGAMIPTGNMGMIPPGPPKNNNTSFARK